ncbi:glutathione S-transferase family protein [Dongia soli]|uniref:Glutathione S-transferase family protein n=1 Tax=Dongia soli TaxID=600628 RepID=A0ABU5E603_9PROT|nr:glutathione S-transferase family protein [Dongia soli]MDY0881700.1 glutathione S-transferase family protein [Dongia soli]
MTELTLYIGNKNYSSWSLRPWLALQHSGLPFREVLLPLRQPDSKAQFLALSPAGKVPVLRHGDVVIWESLAICEYLAELAPQAGLWPSGSAARAHARSIANEMHAGFGGLRANLPMDLRSDRRAQSRAHLVAAEIARIGDIWRQARLDFGRHLGGPFLFGSFTIADAMYAPVVSRFRTYGVTLDEVGAAYMSAILDWPAFRAWEAAAAAEGAVIDFDIFEQPR